VINHHSALLSVFWLSSNTIIKPIEALEMQGTVDTFVAFTTVCTSLHHKTLLHETKINKILYSNNFGLKIHQL